MQLKARSILILTLLLVAQFNIKAQTVDNGTLALSITFFNKAVYFPSSDIFVKVTISNKGPMPWRFKLADDKRWSIGFEAKTLTNKLIPPANAWKLAMTGTSPAFYREMSLEPGEEYSFVENISEYLNIEEPGAYVLSCILYPELFGGMSKYILRSNSLAVSLRPKAPTESIAENFYVDTGSILKAENISPDEVVSRTIIARQKSRWNEFFLYMDIERLLKNNSGKKEAYIRASDSERRRMLENYKTDLKESIVDKDITVVPSSFEIIETKYSASYGTVRVLKKFAYSGFSMLKEYVYELEKMDGVWYIVSYTVINKGSE